MTNPKRTEEFLSTKDKKLFRYKWLKGAYKKEVSHYKALIPIIEAQIKDMEKKIKDEEES